MRYHLLTVALLPLALCAQSTMTQPVTGGQAFTQWDTEINLDTIDQERLPQRVTGGILATANISNFIIHQNNRVFSSYMKVGADLGGFVDFAVTKHFAIQGRLLLTSEQNRLDDTDAQNELWAFGVEIPVLFLARFGNLEKGYLSFGGGPYTHFNYASNIGRKGAEVYKLHDNNSGLTATVTYEFPAGVQLMANYSVSLTDIISFHKQNDPAATAIRGIYPQRVELGIAYRWRTRPRKSSNH